MNRRRLFLSALWAMAMLALGGLTFRRSGVLSAVGLPGIGLSRLIPMLPSVTENDLLFARVQVLIIWGGSFAAWFAAAYGALSLWARGTEKEKEKEKEKDTSTPPGSALALDLLGSAVTLILIVVGAADVTSRGESLLPSQYESEPVEAYRIGPTRDEILWRIEAVPDRALNDLRYGEVPEGFRQVVPAFGAPRALRNDESLVAELFMKRFIYETYGRAIDDRRVAPGILMSSRRILPRGLSRDQIRSAVLRELPPGTDMRKVKSRMVQEDFACRDWTGPGVGSFLACRRTEAGGVAGTHTWEVSFMPSRDGNGKVERVLVSVAADTALASAGGGAARLRDFAARYAAAWSSQNAVSVASFYAPTGLLTINQGKPNAGRDAIAAAAQEFMTAFPDLTVRMDDVSVNGDRAVFRWTASGTNTGPGGTGKAVRFSGYEEWTLGADGSIAASQGHYDEADYQRQLKGSG